LLLTSPSEKLAELIELGIQHEQQHQELMLTDIKHLFSCNPLYPAMYTNSEQHRCPDNRPPSATPFVWMPLEASLLEIGYRGRGFCFDNETPRHRQFVEAFELASQLVTNAEYLAFIEDGGYQNPALWLAEGWDWIRQVNLQQPLYWHKSTRWQEFTLGGLRDLNAEQAVCHISYFEAAAYATWAQARLPTEAEWEYAAQQDLSLQQLFDCCWQWTSSSYAPYPGYAAQAGAIGEYNGKFMVNQYVLRGSSAYTPHAHARVSYRNFFPATARWQRTGIRLARSIADTD
ncbi:MAG: ergothioneine biosynthesis protein EgtB, partial [Burkholderiales bacterium]|nr:ergothioneine biosynthesis protein EgtB [Burkholderiales bacterium]